MKNAEQLAADRAEYRAICFLNAIRTGILVLEEEEDE